MQGNFEVDHSNRYRRNSEYAARVSAGSRDVIVTSPGPLRLSGNGIGSTNHVEWRRGRLSGGIKGALSGNTTRGFSGVFRHAALPSSTSYWKPASSDPN